MGGQSLAGGDRQMTLRWVPYALSDAKQRFRKLRGRCEMKTLLAALVANAIETQRSQLAGSVTNWGAVTRHGSANTGTSPQPRSQQERVARSESTSRHRSRDKK
jgi:hypothetical protein